MKLPISRQMLTVMSVLALGVLAMSLLQPMMPLYLTSIGVVPQTVGLMLSVAMVGMIIGVTFWGWLADKIGIKFPLSIGTFIAGLTVFSFVLTQNVALLFAIFFFWGLVRSALFSPSRGYIGANAPALRKATFMALIAVEMSASRSIGALPSGFLADNLGFQSIFFVAGAISLLAGIIVLAGLRQAQPLKVRATTSAVPHLGNLPSSGEKVNYRLFAIQCVVAALKNWGQGSLMAFLPLLATKVIGVTATKVGILFTFQGITNMLVSIPMGMLADRVGKKKLMILGLVISGVSMVGIAFSQSYTGLMVFVITIGIGMATFTPAALGMVSDSVPRQRQATAMGIYGAFGENIGIIAGTSLGGFIWSAWGPQATFFMGTAAISLGVVISLALLKDRVPEKL